MPLKHIPYQSSGQEASPPKREKFHWTLPSVLERISLAMLIFFSYSGYYGINLWLEREKNEFYQPAFWIDYLVPLAPYWIVVYLGLYTILFAPIFVIRDRFLFRQVAYTYLLTQVASWILFLVFPVKMILRPAMADLTANSYVTWLTKLTYYLDPPNCTFPSMHVAMAAVAAMSCWKVDRYIGKIALTFTGMIGVSTLFVKQHYISDVFMGYILAYTSYYLVLKYYPIKDIPKGHLRMHRSNSIYLVLMYITFMLVLGYLYVSGWTPWKTKGI